MQFGEKQPGINYIERPTAYAIITDGKGRFAFVEHRGHCFLPGGGIEDDESSTDALHRELKEELGWEIAIGDELARAGDYFHARSERQHFHNRSVFYAATIVAMAEPGTPREHDAVWLTIEEVRAKAFHQSHIWACLQFLDAANGS